MANMVGHKDRMKHDKNWENMLQVQGPLKCQCFLYTMWSYEAEDTQSMAERQRL